MPLLAFGQFCFAVQNSNNKAQLQLAEENSFSFHEQLKYLDQFLKSYTDD